MSRPGGPRGPAGPSRPGQGSRAGGPGARAEREREPGHRAVRAAVDAALRGPGVIEGLSPGLYFQRYLPIWKPDLREAVKDKSRALRAVDGLSGAQDPPVRGDAALHAAVVERQRLAFEALCSGVDGVELTLRGLAPFVTGIGQPHPLETGFAFLKPYGVPYLAGSGLKGAVRAACHMRWMEECGRDEARTRLRHYFGSDSKEPDRRRDDAADHERGALIFFDMFPSLPAQRGWADALRLDLVNPHYGPYYQGNGVPADWHSPEPSNFLTLRDGLEWRLFLVYRPRRSPRAGWKEEIGPPLREALTAGGLGAKKSWGYGVFEIVDDTPAAWRAAPVSAPVEARRDQPIAGPAAPGGTPPSVGAPPAGPMVARVSPAAASLQIFIERLRPQDAKSQLDRIRADLARCTAVERARLLEMLEARLRQAKWRAKDIREFMARFESGHGGEPARER